MEEQGVAERFEVTPAHRVWTAEAARANRRVPTRSEGLLWEALRGRKLDGLRFRRQQAIGPYVADFFCAEHRLIVEVDGAVHDDQREYDSERHGELEACGYRVLRLGAGEVGRDLPGCLARIRDAT